MVGRGAVVVQAETDVGQDRGVGAGLAFRVPALLEQTCFAGTARQGDRGLPGPQDGEEFDEVVHDLGPVEQQVGRVEEQDDPARGGGALCGPPAVRLQQCGQFARTEVRRSTPAVEE
ncbi:hypothetical protein OG988_01750 [Streptomyces zaomyceticus]|uniref:hypothetical protein n=1 Tax=Streptomyces zaomyceticus TaxID=68286 RepID=UPI003252065F